jgi:hypothetical protein
MIETKEVDFRKALREPSYHVWCIVKEGKLSSRQRFGEESVHDLLSPFIIFQDCDEHQFL